MKPTLTFIAIILSFAQAALAADQSLQTVAEQSKFQRTGRYDEVQRLCAAYASAWPDNVRCTEFGRTPEGRPMLAIVASRTGSLTPEDAKQRGIPVLLVQAGIHAGEIEGKDAGFLALREQLQDKTGLHFFVLVFVPVFNADGHERFGRWNRPNQVGPQEMGGRATAQNFNLNRDYMKADTPEMQAMLHLLNSWDPTLYVDLHSTDGAQFQPDVANTVDPLYTGTPFLHPAAKSLVKELNTKLAGKGWKPLDFYPEFIQDDDPASGFAVRAYTARFSTAYWALHNRLALLVETHSWKDYATRVHVAHDVLIALADMTTREGDRWRAQEHEADIRARQIAGQTIALNYANGEHVTQIDFPGYAYTREKSEISGALATRYDPTKPEVWHVPLHDEIVATFSVQAPRRGYIVPPAYADAIGEKLTLHGVQFEKLVIGMPRAEVEVFRAGKVSYSKEPVEGHTLVTLDGSWAVERRPLPPGSLYVPIAQPNSRLLMALLEPRSVDSLAAWGFFDTAFEPKEYMEPYVEEQVAADMLAHDPKIAAQFRQRLTDPDFAASPQARLDFFYQHHPSWDERLNLYPVYRVAFEP